MAQGALSVLTLFGSTGTLLCCALPVAIGVVAGTAAIGSVVSAFPWLVPLSQHKQWVFAGAGALIAVNAIVTLRRPRASCDVSAGCGAATRFARRALWASVAIYLTAGYFAYGKFVLARLF